MSKAEDVWPEEMPVAQVRIARPTDRLEEVVRFYRDARGLEQTARSRATRATTA